MKKSIAIVATLFVAAVLAAATPDQLLTAGKEAFAQQNFEKAADLFEQAAKAKPNDAIYQYWLARVYAEQAGRASIFSAPGLASKAKAAAEKAVAIDPKSIEARMFLVEYYLRAPGFMGGGEEKAMEQAQQIRKIDALSGHRAMASVYSAQKKTDLADREYADAVREQPNSPKAHQLLALHYMADKKYKEAAAEFDTSLKLDSAFMPAYFRIGQIAALAGTDFARGEEFLKKYISYKPADDEPPVYRAHYWLGQIYEKQGRKADAKQSYATSLRLHPDQKDVTEALKRVS